MSLMDSHSEAEGSPHPRRRLKIRSMSLQPQPVMNQNSCNGSKEIRQTPGRRMTECYLVKRASSEIRSLKLVSSFTLLKLELEPRNEGGIMFDGESCMSQKSATADGLGKCSFPELDLDDNIFSNSPKKKKIKKSTCSQEEMKQNVMFSYMKTIFKIIWYIFLVFILVIAILLVFVIIPANHFCELERRQTIDMEELQTLLVKNLFGQHLAIQVIQNALHDVLKFRNSSQTFPLVLMFVGWPGSGKTYTTYLLSQIFPIKNNIQNYVVALHFSHIINSNTPSTTYQVLSQASSCGLNLVVFDELDGVSEETYQSITECITLLARESETMPQSIVILVSNIGGNVINEYLLEHVRSGQSRLTVKLKTLEELLTRSNIHIPVYRELVAQGLKVHLVPFLPLEKKHVKMCIVKELKQKEIKPNIDIVNEIMDYISFFPSDAPVFSTSGCKKVPLKVGHVVS